MAVLLLEGRGPRERRGINTSLLTAQPTAPRRACPWSRLEDGLILDLRVLCACYNRSGTRWKSLAGRRVSGHDGCRGRRPFRVAFAVRRRDARPRRAPGSPKRAARPDHPEGIRPPACPGG